MNDLYECSQPQTTKLNSMMMTIYDFPQENSNNSASKEEN